MAYSNSYRRNYTRPTYRRSYYSGRSYSGRNYSGRNYSGKEYRRRFTAKSLAINGNPKALVHYFKRQADLGTIVVPDPISEAVGGSFQFSLGQVPGYTDFVQMYDMYKIKGVKVSFIPVANVTGSSTTNMTGTFYFNRLFTALDYNSVQKLTPSQIREYRNCKWTPYNRIHKRWVVPKSSLTGQEGQVFPSRAEPWLSTSSINGGEYNGLLYAMDPLEGSTLAPGLTLFKVEATFYIACKNPK